MFLTSMQLLCQFSSSHVSFIKDLLIDLACMWWHYVCNTCKYNFIQMSYDHWGIFCAFCAFVSFHTELICHYLLYFISFSYLGMINRITIFKKYKFIRWSLPRTAVVVY